MGFLQFINTLAWPQWLLLGAVPLAIISLYFLKLRRQPLEVPSTYLWARTIEDLHVNSIWQKLRQNILLLLQLLVILLLILTLLRPGFRGSDLQGDRFVFLIDTSASMSATDVGVSRLDEAKKQAEVLIEQMESGDRAMIISASNRSHVEQAYTGDRRLLLNKLRGIQPTNRTSSIEEGLRHVAALANPGRSSFDLNDEQAPQALPTTVYLLSDGNFQDIPSLFLGNITVERLLIGSDSPRNLAIVEFSVDRNSEKPDETQAYVRIENFSLDDDTVELELKLNGRLIDATEVKVAGKTDSGPGVGSIAFSLDELEKGVLRAEINIRDDLAIDNVAYATVNPPRSARVLMVTSGNEPLLLALTTSEAAKVADLSEVEPAHLQSDEFKQAALGGDYDLMIFDRCVPPVMPQCDTLFFGSMPLGDTWKRGEEKAQPLVVDYDEIHPLMHLVELGNVEVYRGFPVTAPAGGRSLIDMDAGSLLAIAPRQGYEDAVCGMSLLGESDGKTIVNTDWIFRRSFPVFMLNVVKYLGGSRGALGLKSVRPGDVAMLSTSVPTNEIFVSDPSGKQVKVLREGQSLFVYTKTEKPGAYSIREGTRSGPEQGFAVNLFSSKESDILPRDKLSLEHETIAGTYVVGKARREMWKWVLLLAIGVVMLEWYVYNRRVYL